MSDEIPEAREARDEVRKNFQKPFYLSEPEFSDPVLITIQSACIAYAERVTADLRAKLADAERSSGHHIAEAKRNFEENCKIAIERDAAIARAEAAEKRYEKQCEGTASRMRENVNLTAERDELRREVEALKADKARLDWLEAHGDAIYGQQYFESEGSDDGVELSRGCQGATTGSNSVDLYGKGATFREAIDAARKESK